MGGRFLHPGVLPIGLDIGTSSAKLLQLRRGRTGLRAVSALRFDLPGYDATTDPDAWIDALGSALDRHLGSAGFRSRECVVALSDRFVRVRSVRQPRMSDDETTKAIRLDAPQRLGFSSAEAAQVAWLRAGEVRQGDDFRDEIILVGSDQSFLERLVYRVAAAGLRPLAVEPDFCACARCYTWDSRRGAERDVVRAIVDIGSRSTGVTLLRGPDIAFHKTLEIGGDRFTDAAAEKLGLAPDTVADLRLRRMRSAEGEEIEARVDRALFESIRPIMDDLANEIALCARYYGVTFRGAKPARCILAGGNAREPRLASFIGDSLHIETEVGSPLEGISTTRVPMLDSPSGRQPEWSCAVGLALRTGAAGARSRRSDAATRFERSSDSARGAGRGSAAA